MSRYPTYQNIDVKLKSHLAYVRRSCSGDIRQQSDLFRLTYTLESLKTLGWRNELVTPAEWDSGAFDGVGPAVYVIKAALQSAFTNQGRLITPLAFKVAGDTQTVVEALTINNLTANGSGNIVTLKPQP
ncbi:DUF2913 family protein [Serratia oryzae]|uniref:DUF2913 family protein n=1 Tax=Serratia oryzae TaxID=2034155 RepID=UPI0012E1020B|nr:DUF2913 family protein [Serratia oryzae]